MFHEVNAGDRVQLPADIVAALAASNPDAVALNGDGSQLTYRALITSADQLAEKMIALGVGPDVPVGICLDRSFDYIVAMLASLRAGGAFMPLDPRWPTERLRFVLDDARAPVLVTSPSHRSQLNGSRWTIVSPNERSPSQAHPKLEARPLIGPSNLAYLIYTSGSTGEPKGVEISLGNLCHLIDWHNNTFGVTASDRGSCVAGLGFDAAVWEVWPYLAAGACVSLPAESVRTSPEALREWLISEKVNIAFAPTPLAERMIRTAWPADTALRFLLTGGDTLHVPPIAGLPFAVVNNYGPTECTVVATSGVMKPADDHRPHIPTIGRAIAGTCIHILDDQGQPVRAGAMGEIFIGGAGVGLGYRHRPDLTAERFIPDVFTPDHDGARLYRTGDVGSVLPNGEIAFHGRIDNQVKLRGHRVELAEISAALNRHPHVVQSAVVVRGLGDQMRLVAYVVATSDTLIAAAGLRDFLSSRLPDYMLPSTFVALSSLPLSASGKLDATALPLPTPENILADADYCPPSSPVEDELTRIVAELLAIDHVGVHDNFFLLGGHSLLGTQLVLRARDAFGAELTLRDLFQAQTVAKLAAKIEQRLVERLEQMSDEEASRLLAS
jgi:amino acid adenylation domain-containing protein